MVIGVPKEIKKAEYRVGMTPSGVEELKSDGHSVLIENNAGDGSGFADKEYLEAGAELLTRDELFGRADLIVKVKEPLPEEYGLLREGQALFTYLHLAPNQPLTDLLISKKITGLAYETLQKEGGLPLLAPMSEIAGRMAPIMGAFYLQRFLGGAGILPGGAIGVKPAKALILGAGIVGTNAARICIGLGMDTLVMNRGLERLQRLDELFLGKVKTLPMTSHSVKEEIREADILIGAVLIPGGKTPVLVTREMLRIMKKGTVIVDVSVDQGGCIETSRPSTHADPTYEIEGIIHYTVANMPGAYPRTSTLALTDATLSYVRTLARKGIETAIREDPAIKSALNTYRGEIVYLALAESTGRAYRPMEEIL
ncbi:MAG: alanine dehydrogenase [Dissulfurispiraceae bacterium]